MKKFQHSYISGNLINKTITVISPPLRNCDYKFLKKLLCLFQSSKKNSAMRPSFFCNTYFHLYNQMMVDVFSHFSYLKFVHTSNFFEAILDGFIPIASFCVQFSKILDMNHSKSWSTFSKCEE